MRTGDCVLALSAAAAADCVRVGGDGDRLLAFSFADDDDVRTGDGVRAPVNGGDSAAAAADGDDVRSGDGVDRISSSCGTSVKSNCLTGDDGYWFDVARGAGAV